MTFEPRSRKGTNRRFFEAVLLLVSILATPLAAAELRGVLFADRLTPGPAEVSLQGTGVLRWMGLVGG